STVAYFGQFVWHIRGALNASAWHHAWQRVLDRHPVLRTQFVWRDVPQPLQMVLLAAMLPWAFYDWRDLSPQVQDERLALLQQADLKRGFDLSVAPVLRLTLIRLSEDTYLFMQSLHHLLLDGWSQPLIFNEVLVYYRAVC